MINPIVNSNDAPRSSRTACDHDGVWPTIALARWESEGGALPGIRSDRPSLRRPMRAGMAKALSPMASTR